MASLDTCHICSATALYRCLGCISPFCRQHMVDHVGDTQLREALLKAERLEGVVTAFLNWYETEGSMDRGVAEMVLEVIANQAREVRAIHAL